MELKELIAILKKNKVIFWSIWLSIILLTGIFYHWINFSAPYQANFSINLGRSEQGRGADYSVDHDHYYRLEADELFAKRVSNWLQEPTIVREILAKSKQSSPVSFAGSLEEFFEVGKQATGLLSVTFATSSSQNTQAIFSATQKTLQSQVEKLNRGQSKPGWFQLIFSQPLTLPKSYPISPFLAFSLAGGLFLAILGTLIRHYWQEIE